MKLSGEQKIFIVQHLASFFRPTDIQSGLMEVYGIDVSLPQISAYDPTQASGRRLAEDLKKVFDETRARFLKEREAIPIAHQTFRLWRLQRIIDDPAFEDDPRVIMDALEQAAKEMGGFYNRGSTQQTVLVSDSQEANSSDQPPGIPQHLWTSVLNMFCDRVETLLDEQERQQSIGG